MLPVRGGGPLNLAHLTHWVLAYVHKLYYGEYAHSTCSNRICVPVCECWGGCGVVVSVGCGRVCVCIVCSVDIPARENVWNIS